MANASYVLIAAAALLGAAYAYSPLSTLFAGAVLGILYFAVKGIGGRERRWVLGVLIAALALRLGILLALYVTTDPDHENFRTLFGDDRFSIQRSLWVLNLDRGTEIALYWRQAVDEGYGSLTYDRVLAAVQSILGPAPHALPLLSVAAFLSGCALLHRTVRRRLGGMVAMGGLITLAFWPTLVGWSASILKESFVTLLSAVALAAALAVLDASRMWRRVMLAAVVLVAVWGSGVLRIGTDYILAASLCCGYAAAFGVRRPRMFLLILVLLAAGAAAMAMHARGQSLARRAVTRALQVHLGQAQAGNSYLAADQRFYYCYARSPADDCTVVAVDEAARFVIRAVTYFVLMPFPFHVVTPTMAAFVPQFVAWYVLILLAVVGASIGWRRDPALVATCAAFCVVAVGIIAPHSANVGTAIRHRDMIVPFVVWLSALGAIGGLARFVSGRHAAD